MRSRGQRAVLAGLVAGAAVITAAMAPAGGVSPVPGRQAAASMSGHIGDVLYSVAAVSRSNVWAFGCKFGSEDFCVSALIEHWDGRKWTVIRSPRGVVTLGAVSGASARNAWAVGPNSALLPTSAPTLSVHWDGHRWRKVPVVQPAGLDVGGLGSGAAISATNVWAVGDHGSLPDRTLIEHWNGVRWRLVRSPNLPGDDVLSAVAVVSPANIWAVGEDFDFTCTGSPCPTVTLVEHWNGTKWTIVPSPSPGQFGQTFLSGVSALSGRDIWAVGNFSTGQMRANTLVEHWNGVSWAVVPSPSPKAGIAGDSLYGVAAISKNNVWAVGQFAVPISRDQRPIEHWNGTRWQMVPITLPPSPNSGEFAALYGIAALSASNVWAVGEAISNYHANPLYRTLIVHWNGKKWSPVPSPTP